MPHNVTERRAPTTVPEDLQELGVSYRAATRAEKGRILDEVVRRTGYHRKHAVRLLRRERVPPRRLYNATVAEALVLVWRASGRACGKRLKALMPELVGSMELDGRLPRDVAVRAMLLRMSAATIDRLLAPARRKPSLSEIERHLEALSEMVADFTALAIPADLPQEERERLETLRRQLLDRAEQAMASPTRAKLPRDS